MILFETTLGDFKIEFFEKEAPLSVANFRKYIDGGFFNGTIFHRIVPGFVIQGGGFTEDMTQKKTEAPIKNEADNGLKNSRGTLSMARTNDINSATSQFFVNLKDNDFLDHSRGNFGYAACYRGHGGGRQDRRGRNRPQARLRGRAARGRYHEDRAKNRSVASAHDSQPARRRQRAKSTLT
jgi:cyclophilin family peptidyl-prolyl cis-trans isomerase